MVINNALIPGGGRSGTAKCVLCRIGVSREVQLQAYVQYNFFFTGFLKLRYKIKGDIQIAKIVDSYLSCTAKKHKLDPSLIDTRSRFNVDTTSYNIVQQGIEVETATCVHQEFSS